MSTSEYLPLLSNIEGKEYSTNLEKLKLLLLQCDGTTRKLLCDIYGFTLQMDGDSFLINHDGKKIGSGEIAINGHYCAFEVYAKNTGLKLNELFEHFGNGLNKKYGSIHNLGTQGSERKPNEYAFSFLLGLLKEISAFGIQFFNIFSAKKLIVTKGRPIGKIIPKNFVANQLHGNFSDFHCEILDNTRLRQYATVFYQTAIAVGKDLQVISGSDALDGTDIKYHLTTATSKLKPFLVDGFSKQMINHLSRPPHPFGIKELFIRCLRYWTSNRSLAAADNHRKMSFSGFSIRLDYLFEDYVGLMFEKLLSEPMKYVPKQRYRYTEKSDENRMLEPDHIFIDEHNKKLVIVEVKYSNFVAVREHVAQLLSYLDYKYIQWLNFEKIGIIAYPGESPSCTKIEAFSHNINIVKVTSDFERSIDTIRACLFQSNSLALNEIAPVN